MKKTLLLKKYSYLVLLFLLVTQVSISQTRITAGVPQTFNITTPSALTATYSSNLIPGDIVILANGTYSSSATMKINGEGTEALPITYKPATPGGVTFTGGQTMDIGGDWCIIDGFRWKGGNGTSNFIEFRDSYNYANNTTLKNCVVDGVTVSGGINPLNGASVKHNWVILYGTKNTVINCSFLNKITSGNMILAEYQFNATTDGTTGGPNMRCDEVGHKILNNYFYNYSKIDEAATNSGDSEAIRIGESNYQNVQSNALVQNNYFVQTDGENEIITNKSKGNSFINNTFRRCRGSLVMRHGSNAVVNGNYFLGENVEGTGALRINDSYHTIRNNYIQDCVNTLDQAQWNNGITFQGGNDANDVVCTSTSMTNGYQKVQNIDVSNNTIVNTNAPLFYNLAKGTTDPTGTVSNNLIYFATGNANTTPVISGSATTDYINLGTALTYAGNQYKGTTLGVTNAGFAENTGITATASGEVFTFTGATGKGANMGAYVPTTDAMVGYGIGACFVNNTGVLISNGDCNVVIPESLIIGSLTPFTNVAGSADITVTANVSWSATTTDAWITTISPNTGTGDATVSVSVTANTGAERTGSVTFTQTLGTSNIVRTLNVTQAAPPPPDPRDGLTKINPNAADVEVFSFCNEEVNGTTKLNYAINSLDKDLNTQWSGSYAVTPCVDSKVYIIYNLKGAFDLELVDIATTASKTYKLQILVSSTGTADADFTNPFPVGDLLSNQDASFKAFVLPTTALGTKYVKIVGSGQVENISSSFTSIHEIEFYGEVAGTAGVDDFELAKYVRVFPIPTKDILKIKLLNTGVKTINIFDITGRKLLQKSVNISDSEVPIDVAKYSNGVYFINFLGENGLNLSKRIVIAH